MFVGPILLAIALLVPIAAQGQPRIARVGILVPDMGRSQSQAIKGFRDELKQLGYQERKTILLKIYNAKGDRSALQPAADELVKQKTDVDAIVTTGTRATQVMKSVTADLPIVFIHPADPMALGFVKSLKRPEANLTGVAAFDLQMTEKRLQLLKEIIPGIEQIHIFYDSNDKYSRENLEFVEKAAAKLGLKAVEHGVKSPGELKVTVDKLQTGNRQAIFHIPNDLVESQADFIFETARQKKLPTMFNTESWVIKGALAAYGPSYYEMGRQAARMVDAILKGRKPGSLPVEHVAKFDLTLNYRTASFIGLTLPGGLLKRAEKVIR
ncbi:MAG: ABC transporter substrate-binding protein [Alphaproteobacteria bacterium]